MRRWWAAWTMAVLLSGCGAAQRPTPETPAPPQHPFADLRVLRAGPVPAVFAERYGVHPTVDTAAEPEAAVILGADTAAWDLSRALLARGVLPDAGLVRVEEFVQAFTGHMRLADPAPVRTVQAGDLPFQVATALFPSPNREGYHVLAVAIAAPHPALVEPPPGVPCVVVDAAPESAVPADATLRMALDPEATVSFAGAAPRRLVDVPPLARSRHDVAGALRACAGFPNRSATLLVSDARPGRDAEALAPLARDLGLVVLGLEPDAAPYDDVFLRRLARAGGGGYHAGDEGAARVRGALRPAAFDLWSRLRFDPAVVARWRVLGFEARAGAEPEQATGLEAPPAIPAGGTVVVLYEIRLRGAGAPGELQLTAATPAGPLGATLPLEPVRAGAWDLAPGWSRLAWLAAAFAEKLRGDYWVRALTYDALLARLPSAADAVPEIATLVDAIRRARDLDRRGDRFAAELPVERMDFDEVPLAGAR